jgi:hypothetical protein
MIHCEFTGTVGTSLTHKNMFYLGGKYEKGINKNEIV